MATTMSKAKLKEWKSKLKKDKKTPSKLDLAPSSYENNSSNNTTHLLAASGPPALSSDSRLATRTVGEPTGTGSSSPAGSSDGGTIASTPPRVAPGPQQQQQARHLHRGRTNSGAQRGSSTRTESRVGYGGGPGEDEDGDTATHHHQGVLLPDSGPSHPDGSSVSSSPASSPSSSPRYVVGGEEAEGDDAGGGGGGRGGVGGQVATRSPRTGFRKKSYSTLDVHHQSLHASSSTPLGSVSHDEAAYNNAPSSARSSSGGGSARRKRRSAKAAEAAHAHGHNNSTSNGTTTDGSSTEAGTPEGAGDGAGEEASGRTWRRWSALVANMPLPLSSVLTKSNSFLLSNSSSSTTLAANDVPTTPHGPDTGTLRRRGTAVVVMRSPEEEIKVLREHIEQLQILLQEKHNEMQHYKTQLQATKHELAALKAQLLGSKAALNRSEVIEESGVNRSRSNTPNRDSENPQPRLDQDLKPEYLRKTKNKDSKNLGEGSLIEIGSGLYDDSDEGQAEGCEPSSSLLTQDGNHYQRNKLESEAEQTTTEEGAAHTRNESQQRKERKKSMLMAMSRVDHSRFGMEVGGRSSLRARPTKERGGANLSQLFTKITEESDIIAPASGAIAPPLVATHDSGFVVEEEQDCEVTTTFFAAEGSNWYAEHFYGQPHRNFLGIETPLGTVLVSCKREEKPTDDKAAQGSNDATLLLPSSPGSFFRVMLFTQDGDQKMFVPSTAIGENLVLSKESIDKLLNAVNPLLCYTGIVKEIVHPDMPEAIRQLESKERPRKYKFGLLLVKEGQTQEEDIFSNSGGSVDWYEFLNFIGDKVRLKGWNRFAGGLDVKTDTTGEFSRFTEWRGSEIMWHVATMLPPGEGTQQIARKRHIGNDICTLVFLDGKDVTYSAKTIRSHFIHNIITIRRIPSDSLEDDASLTRYHVSVATKRDVPMFGPPLPKPAVFRKDANFKDFLLSKMINAELAAYRTMYFSKRLRLGRRALLETLVSDFFPVDS